MFTGTAFATATATHARPRIRATAFGAALILGVMIPFSGCAASDPSPVGTWGESDGAYLELAGDGALTGSDGCNRLMGKWEAEGTTVSFIGVATTMMACVDVDTWLSALDTAVVGADELAVFDVAGEQIGALPRR